MITGLILLYGKILIHYGIIPQQILSIVQTEHTTLLLIKDPPEYMDATDGLAVAVCHYFQRKPSAGGEQYGSWKSFISKNPDKIK